MVGSRMKAFIVVAVVFVSSAGVNQAGVFANSWCLPGPCSSVSQRCAYAGTEDPPECKYCSGNTSGGFCGFYPDSSCTSTGDEPCGITYTGLCRQLVCSGGAGDPNKPCATKKCSDPKPPPGIE